MSTKRNTLSINQAKSQKTSIRNLTVQMFKMRVKEFNNALSKGGDDNDLEAMVQFDKLVSIGKRILQILGNPAAVPLGLQGWSNSLSNLCLDDHKNFPFCWNNNLRKKSII